MVNAAPVVIRLQEIQMMFAPYYGGHTVPQVAAIDSTRTTWAAVTCFHSIPDKSSITPLVPIRLSA